MSKLVWDKLEERLYEAGIRHGVIYPMDGAVYGKGVVWNGLTGVTESPSGAEATKLWADDINYLTLFSAEEFGATVEAYTYPEEFAECDGTAEIAPGIYAGQQTRKMFGFSYRTILGNAAEGEDYGYKLHVIYGAKASPSEKSYTTVNDNPDAVQFSWELTTTPVEITVSVNGKTLKPTACLTFDSTKIDSRKLKMLEDILYGTDKDEPRLPLPDEIITLMTAPLPTEASVTATDDSTERYGKQASDLQENIVISGNKITGNLKYVSDYTDFSKTTEQQSGNFLALDLAATNQGTITTQLVGGYGEPKPVTDGFCVYRITDPKSQKVSVTVSKDEYSDTVVYDLSGLTCAAKS